MSNHIFPQPTVDLLGLINEGTQHGGLTKRELFALVAMHAYIVSSGSSSSTSYANYASDGAIQADALIRLLEKK